MQDSIFDLQAALCQSIANTTRLRIIHALRDSSLCVSDLAVMTDVSPSKVSQHLAVLKSHGVVSGQRVGAEVIYHVANVKIIKICDLMREVLVEQAEKRTELVRAVSTNR